MLISSETHMGNSEIIDILNFDFVVSFRRDNCPVGGIAIY